MPEGPPPPSAGPQGHLLIVGGSERLVKGMPLLWKYLQLCDQVPGRRNIVIVTSATGHPEALGGEYLRIFGEMGWPGDALHMPLLATADEAAVPATAALLAGAAGIYMTGGDQVDLVDILDGTPSGDALRTAYAAGAIIGGTSAGATVMGDPMIARGGGSGEVQRGEVTLHPGFGLAGHRLIIDTHFGRRGRFPRLAAAVGEYPGTTGVGIDENTALHVGPERPDAEVLGTGVVYVLESPMKGDPPDPAVTGVTSPPLTLYVLREGERYMLPQRR